MRLLSGFLILLATAPAALAQYEAFLTTAIAPDAGAYGALVEPLIQDTEPGRYGAYDSFCEPRIDDGLYDIEALDCFTCPTARPEILALIKAGWNIKVVDDSSEVARLAKPANIPAVVQIRDGRVVAVVEWPFDRWDVGELVGVARPTQSSRPPVVAYTEVKAVQPQAYMYAPAGNSSWTDGSGGTSLQHLIGHGYDPNILRNTPPHLYNLLHGDAHEGRRSRVVPIPSYSSPAYSVGYAAPQKARGPVRSILGILCPTGSG